MLSAIIYIKRNIILKQQKHDMAGGFNDGIIKKLSPNSTCSKSNKEIRTEIKVITVICICIYTIDW